MELLDKIEEYWTGRAEGYSQVNQGELATEQREKWKKNLMSHLKGKKPEETKVLELVQVRDFSRLFWQKRDIR